MNLVEKALYKWIIIVIIIIIIIIIKRFATHKKSNFEVRSRTTQEDLITAMTAFVDNSSLDASERNSMAITLNIHTKSHTARGRPTPKNCVFRRGREPSRIPEVKYSETSQKRGRKLKKFVYERIHLSIPKSSRLRGYVEARGVTKNVCNIVGRGDWFSKSPLRTMCSPTDVRFSHYILLKKIN